MGNHVYLRLNEEPDAWVVDASWLDSLPDQLQAWRDPRIVSADIEDMDHIEISHVDARIVMDKNPNGNAWHFSFPERKNARHCHLDFYPSQCVHRHD